MCRYVYPKQSTIIEAENTISRRSVTVEGEINEHEYRINCIGILRRTKSFIMESVLIQLEGGYATDRQDGANYLNKESKIMSTASEANI